MASHLWQIDLKPPITITCGELATRLGAQVVGDNATELTHVAPMHRANAGALTFLSQARFLSQLQTCAAAAVIVKAEWVEHCSSTCIVSVNPYLDYARATAILHPPRAIPAQVHSGAMISPDVAMGEGVHIDAYASIGEGTKIGDRAIIGAGCRIGKNVLIGEGTRLHPNVVVEDGCQLGDHCLVQAGVIIGSDGFGYAQDGETWVPIPQIGRAIIGNRVHIGANTTIDRGAMDDTIIEDGVILDNQIQIAHNVVIGENTAIAGCVGIAGSAKIGRRCTIGGATTILGHLDIVDDVHINAMSLVTSSIASPGSYASSTPLDESSRWRKNFARFRKLDKMARKLAALERIVLPAKRKSG